MFTRPGRSGASRPSAGPCSRGGGGWRLDGFAGYRYRGFDESLEIYKDIRPLGPAFVPGTTILCNDYFRTRNQFHGAAFGLDWQTEVGG